MGVPKRFETRDIGLAAYLKLKGFKLVGWRGSGNRILFVFETPDLNLIKEAEQEYRLDAEESKVVARQFFETYMNLRSLMLAAAREMESSGRHDL